MDRDLTLEKHLLSHSRTSDADISALLQEKYAVSGQQKPFMPLIPNETPDSEKKPAKDPVSSLLKNEAIRPTRSRAAGVRRQLKKYIKIVQHNQKRLIHEIHLHRSSHSPLDKFPLQQKIVHYDIPRYSQYEKLHFLWNQYMKDLLFGEQTTPSPNTMLPKLSSADYNGCLLTVLESRNPALIGITGIVIYESQHLFIIVVPPMTSQANGRTVSPNEMVGGLRILPKRHTLFGFSVDNGDSTVHFTMIGSRFELRSADRAARKFKAHNSGNIL